MQASEALVAGTHSRLRRLDLRVAVGVLLMLVAVLGGASLIRTAQARTPVLVAADTVQPGEVIQPSDLRVVEMSVPAGVAHLSASAESSARSDRALSRHERAGQEPTDLAIRPQSATA